MHFGQKKPGSCNYVVRHFVSMIDGNLLVGAIESLMGCEQLESIGLLPSTYGANEGFSMTVLPDFTLCIAGGLTSSMLMFEKFAVNADGLFDTTFHSSGVRPQPQSSVKIQIPNATFYCGNNIKVTIALVEFTASL